MGGWIGRSKRYTYCWGCKYIGYVAHCAMAVVPGGHPAAELPFLFFVHASGALARCVFLLVVIWITINTIQTKTNSF